MDLKDDPPSNQMINEDSIPIEEEANFNNKKKRKETEKLWDEIGFHKPIAGFWFNIVYTLIGIILSATLTGYLMSFFFPWPESFGYKDIVFGYFTLLWMLFDTGTRSVMSRFIPETNINNPQKMVRYIQYFIWYQMITGLIQTTVVSVYAIFYAPQTSMAYTIWIMLVASTTQYPGFLHVFKNALEALQQFDKAQTLNFLTGTIMQRISELGFVYLGRIWGEANPQIGPLLGIAIGAAIGLYVDDFFAMIISAVFFSRVMKSYGISTRSCFYIEFTWEEIKPVLFFSLKVASPEVLQALLNFINLMLWLTFVPQYTTLMIMAYIGGSIADIMNWFGVLSIDAPVAESYMNGKKTLTQYYIGQITRFNSLMIGFFGPLILIIQAIMPIIWVDFGMVNYVAGSFFIIPRLIKLAIERFLQVPMGVIVGADRPNIKMILGFTQAIFSTLLLYLYLAVWQAPIQYGIIGTAWIMELGMIPIAVVVSTVAYIYVHKNITNIIIPWKQIIYGIIGPAIISYLCLRVVLNGIFFPAYNLWGAVPGILAAVPFLFSVVFFIYFPLTVYFGAWDSINLEEFKKAAVMSGPSKFLVGPLYKMVEALSKKSKLHDKFGMDAEIVLREAKELLAIKLENREKMEKTV